MLVADAVLTTGRFDEKLLSIWLSSRSIPPLLVFSVAYHVEKSPPRDAFSAASSEAPMSSSSSMIVDMLTLASRCTLTYLAVVMVPHLPE
jgi:hypothetical protein